MSTPLVTALRESCGYLRDGGYHQTAQLMTVAADEIERLNNQIQALGSRAPVEPRMCAARPALPAGLRAQRARPFPSPDDSAAPACLAPMRFEGLRLGGEYDL